MTGNKTGGARPARNAGQLNERTFIDEWSEELFEGLAVATRRHIESWLYFGRGGVPPGEFTKAIKRLVESKRIKEVPDARWPGSYLYARPGTRRSAIDSCSRRAGRARQILERADLGKTGERYARSVIIKSGAFVRVTQRERLGNARLPGGSIVDIKARMKVSGKLTAVEVKNTREVFYPGPGEDRVFNPLILAAIREEAFPLLVIAHITDEAASICEEIGLGVLHLRRQILPNGVLAHERLALRRAFGPERYDFIEFGRPRHRNISPKTDEEVRRLSDPGFLAASLKKWIGTSEVLSKLSDEEILTLRLGRILWLVSG
jgi:hypothetical protein